MSKRRVSKSSLRAVGDALLRPADVVAARVTAPGPQWCAPEDKPSPRKFSRVIRTAPDMKLRPKAVHVQLKKLLARMDRRQLAEFYTLKLRWPSGHIPICEKIAYCRMVLGDSISEKHGRALARIAKKANEYAEARA